MSDSLFTPEMLDKAVLDDGQRPAPGTYVLVTAEKYNELEDLREQHGKLRDVVGTALRVAPLWVPAGEVAKEHEDEALTLTTLRQLMEIALGLREQSPDGDASNAYFDPADYLSDHEPPLTDEEAVGFGIAIQLLDKWRRP